MVQRTLIGAHHFEGVGRVAAACAQLEFEQSMLTGALVASDPTVRDSVVNPGVSFGRLQRLARTLAMARFGAVGGEAYPHPLAIELDRWMTSAQRLVERRNTYLHSLWGVGADQQVGALTLRKPHQSITVSLADLDALQRDIQELVDDADPLLGRVTAEVRAREIVVLNLLAEGEGRRLG
jgi:hypothetical protein